MSNKISDQIKFIDRGRIIGSGDKEDYLDRWRRLRLEVPSGVKTARRFQELSQLQEPAGFRC